MKAFHHIREAEMLTDEVAAGRNFITDILLNNELDIFSCLIPLEV